MNVFDFVVSSFNAYVTTELLVGSFFLETILARSYSIQTYVHTVFKLIFLSSSLLFFKYKIYPRKKHLISGKINNESVSVSFCKAFPELDRITFLVEQSNTFFFETCALAFDNNYVYATVMFKRYDWQDTLQKHGMNAPQIWNSFHTENRRFFSFLEWRTIRDYKIFSFCVGSI